MDSMDDGGNICVWRVVDDQQTSAWHVVNALIPLDAVQKRY